MSLCLPALFVGLLLLGGCGSSTDGGSGSSGSSGAASSETSGPPWSQAEAGRRLTSASADLTPALADLTSARQGQQNPTEAATGCRAARGAVADFADFVATGRWPDSVSAEVTSLRDALRDQLSGLQACDRAEDETDLLAAYRTLDAAPVTTPLTSLQTALAAGGT